MGEDHYDIPRFVPIRSFEVIPQRWTSPLDAVLGYEEVKELINASFALQKKFSDGGNTAIIYNVPTRLNANDATALAEVMGRPVNDRLLVKVARPGSYLVDNNEALTRDAQIATARGVAPFAIATSGITDWKPGINAFLMEQNPGIPYNELSHPLNEKQLSWLFYQWLMLCEAIHFNGGAGIDLKTLFIVPDADPIDLGGCLVSHDLPYISVLPEKGYPRASQVKKDFLQAGKIMTSMLPSLKTGNKPYPDVLEDIRWRLAEDTIYFSFYEAAKDLDDKFQGEFSAAYTKKCGYPPVKAIHLVEDSEWGKAEREIYQLLADQEAADKVNRVAEEKRTSLFGEKPIGGLPFIDNDENRLWYFLISKKALIGLVQGTTSYTGLKELIVEDFSRSDNMAKSLRITSPITGKTILDEILMKMVEAGKVTDDRK